MAEKSWSDLKKLELDISGRHYNWWSIDHSMDLQLYIGGLSTELVRFKLNSYNAIESEHKIAALRQLQHESSEFLFSLLCSLNYDIELMPAWMSLYQNSDIYNMISELMKPLSKSDMMKLLLKVFSQENCSLKVNGRDASLELFLETFYMHLILLKNDFLSEISKSEYVSTKHSYRVNSGESSFRVSIDGTTYHDLIFGQETILYIAAKSLKGTTSRFGKRDVQVTHATVSYSAEAVTGVLEILLSLSESLVNGLKHLAIGGEKILEMHIPDHKKEVSRRAAFTGNGSIIQRLKDFRIEEKVIQATLDMDLSIKVSRKDLFFNSFGNKKLLQKAAENYNAFP